MSEFLPNHYMNIDVYKHRRLPLYKTGEFDFFRCVPFDSSMYGVTVSNLHKGNLREIKCANRYSLLFSGKKVSYWADSKKTARAEMNKHGCGHNLLTFFAYDDATATFPTLSTERDLLTIIDGRQLGFHEILKKDDLGIPLTEQDKRLIAQIEQENPDCLAYWSEARAGGVNYLFFENGFKKLSIRDVSLRLGDEQKICKAKIYCSVTCDYTAYPKSYGDYFMPKAKIKHNYDYDNSVECTNRIKTKEYWINKRNTETRKGPHIEIRINPKTGEVIKIFKEGDRVIKYE